MMDQNAQALQGMQQHIGTILCCMCGASIAPNPANMCATCISNQVDITEDIPRQNILQWCRTCGRYLQPPKTWVTCDLESKELLAVCLKRIKTLSKVRLVNAKFMWTEPHSKRVIVRLTIQKEVYGTILQQEFDIVYLVRNQQCERCQRVMAKDTWNASVQVRQKVSHKRTFLWLEQLILKHRLHTEALNLKDFPDGLDFYFSQRNTAVRFSKFLQDVVPVRVKESQRLISHDIRSNTFNYKYTFCVEIAPVCKDDLVYLPQRLCQKQGGISPLLVCYKITKHLHFIDPQTLRTIELQPSVFWHDSFNALLSSRQLIDYTVVDVELQQTVGRFQLAEVTVATSSGQTLTVMSHLGRILHPGDTVAGYDIANSNFNDEVLHNRRIELPDIVLIRKRYPVSRARASRRRMWKLRTLEETGDDETMSVSGARMPLPKKRGIAVSDEDARIFIEELEEDPELRQQINIYRTGQPGGEHLPAAAEPEVQCDEDDEDDLDADDDVPLIEITELLDSIALRQQQQQGFSASAPAPAPTATATATEPAECEMGE
eukprot:gnl/Trimastix_PCT/459.p1 GENE.gnl/Trimastix_PCT/459~~gnl/Trimastix_PCT/459.p1  ORF type:complete len:546 (+),score=167.52 gnl/Trimastix_PCT/459:137-1774(+)